MSLRARLQRLERRDLAPGVCPVCSFGPDDVRTVVCVAPRALALPPPAEPRQRCPRCGGWLGPIRLTGAVAPAGGAPLGQDDADEPAQAIRAGRRSV